MSHINCKTLKINSTMRFTLSSVYLIIQFVFIQWWIRSCRWGRNPSSDVRTSSIGLTQPFLGFPNGLHFSILPSTRSLFIYCMCPNQPGHREACTIHSCSSFLLCFNNSPKDLPFEGIQVCKN